MSALSKELDWPVVATIRGATGTPRLRRTGRIMAHTLGWPLLLKIGLATGFGLAAAVQHLLAA